MKFMYLESNSVHRCNLLTSRNTNFKLCVRAYACGIVFILIEGWECGALEFMHFWCVQDLELSPQYQKKKLNENTFLFFL